MDTQVAELLGGERVLGASVKTNLELARAIRKGLPAEAAVQLAEAILDVGAILNLEPLQVGLEFWEKGSAAAFGGSFLFGFVREALNRRKAGNGEWHCPPTFLTPEQSDAVVRTARVMAKAIDVLGDRKKAAHW